MRSAEKFCHIWVVHKRRTCLQQFLLPQDHCITIQAERPLNPMFPKHSVLRYFTKKLLRFGTLSLQDRRPDPPWSTLDDDLLRLRGGVRESALTTLILPRSNNNLPGRAARLTVYNYLSHSFGESALYCQRLCPGEQVNHLHSAGQYKNKLEKTYITWITTQSKMTLTSPGFAVQVFGDLQNSTIHYNMNQPHSQFDSFLLFLFFYFSFYILCFPIVHFVFFSLFNFSHSFLLLLFKYVV
jgi:hypothetical protein